MNQKKINPADGPDLSESVVLDASQEQENDSIKPIALPKKSEVVLETFLKHRSLNTFQANNLYGDTCLHTAVSVLERNHGIQFNHIPERIINRIGKPVRVMRYCLVDREKAQQLHSYFQRERGITEEQA